MIAEPVVVRSPGTSQPLLPAVPGPSVAKRVTASSPRARATRSRHSLVAKPANRMCVAIQMASGTHGSQGVGVRPVRAKRSSRAAPAASPSLTPSTYARTQAAVPGSSASMAP